MSEKNANNFYECDFRLVKRTRNFNIFLNVTCAVILDDEKYLHRTDLIIVMKCVIITL